MIDPNALRIVLLGLPQAGTSSLLQAFQTLPAESGKPLLIEGAEQLVRDVNTGRKSLDTSRELLRADAFVLPVVASAADAELNEIVRFLGLLEEARGRHILVAGLPVFVVLTKSDLLARDGDTYDDWTGRVAERQAHLESRCAKFLALRTESIIFGQLVVETAATALHQPAVTERPVSATESWGVAELYRRCLDRAEKFRQRRRTSGRRLAATLAVFLVGVALTGGVGWLMLGRATEPASRLQGLVEVYQAREGTTPSLRLREPLQQRIGELTELKREADFPRLPAASREFVQNRLDELLAYRDYRDRLEEARAPAQDHTVRELDETTARLNAELAPPAKYRAEWSETEAVLLRNERLTDAQALAAGVEKVAAWYGKLREEGDVLWAFGGPDGATLSWETWATRVTQLLAQADAPPFAAGDRLPGARRLTWAAVLRFDRVADARTDWDLVRVRLQGLRGEAAALGLTAPTALRPALLAIPPGLTVEQARDRFRELARLYPGYQDWPTQPLPEAAVADIHRAAEAAYRALLPAGRDTVARQLQQLSPDGRETPAHWREVGDWLTTTADLNGWREVTNLCARLNDPKADDPVRELAGFLARDQFRLRFTEFTVRIPDELDVPPTGPLTLTLGGSENRTLTFAPVGEPIANPKRRDKVYTFSRQGDEAVVYVPGDALRAELPVRRTAANQERVLVWMDGPSQVFQFARLDRAPRLQPGVVAEGVVLTARPEPLPKLPELMPTVRLVKK